MNLFSVIMTESHSLMTQMLVVAFGAHECFIGHVYNVSREHCVM